MKRHPMLDLIIETSIEEADKLLHLAEQYQHIKESRVILVDEKCSMAIQMHRRPNGQIGYRMGKVSEARIMTPEEAESIIAAHNPMNKTLLLKPVTPFTGFTKAAFNVNESLENCIELHNKNNKVG